MFFFRPPISKDVSEVPSGQGDLFVSPQKALHLWARALGTLRGKERKQLGLPTLSGVPKPILVLHLTPMGAALWVMQARRRPRKGVCRQPASCHLPPRHCGGRERRDPVPVPVHTHV